MFTDINTQGTSGTYHACKDCPASINCCTGTGGVDRAVITPNDISHIFNKDKEKIIKHSNRIGDNMRSIGSYNGKCYFYRNNKCLIYDKRPIDCRLFPFDIRRDDKGGLVLVNYNKICPGRFKLKQYRRAIEELIGCLYPYIDEYADCESPLLDKQSYVVLAPINNGKICLT